MEHERNQLDILELRIALALAKFFDELIFLQLWLTVKINLHCTLVRSSLEKLVINLVKILEI